MRENLFLACPAEDIHDEVWANAETPLLTNNLLQQPIIWVRHITVRNHCSHIRIINIIGNVCFHWNECEKKIWFKPKCNHIKLQLLMLMMSMQIRFIIYESSTRVSWWFPTAARQNAVCTRQRSMIRIECLCADYQWINPPMTLKETKIIDLAENCIIHFADNLLKFSWVSQCYLCCASNYC